MSRGNAVRLNEPVASEKVRGVKKLPDLLIFWASSNLGQPSNLSFFLPPQLQGRNLGIRSRPPLDPAS
jgi:hypothetical protein